ncbi:MAG: hypothetical protein H0T66_16475 [Geodermatophilaceae bacterium]|nr:hypothetical protein [Geodermatophilaceae bacterium]MDQ3455317.1 hypothetical protein [Actinomycetota bacterium]
MATPVHMIPLEISQGDLETRYVEMGDMAIRHAKVPAGTDLTPVLQGLPADRCPSPHWGIVLEGSIRLQHADGSEETARAGEVYHWPAGHTARTDEAVVFLEVGPVGPMREFSEHAKKVLG